MGTLSGPVPLFYAIGILLAVPAWWLTHHSLTAEGAMLNAGLLIGSLIFMASGQSFEQFSGME